MRFRENNTEQTRQSETHLGQEKTAGTPPVFEEYKDAGPTSQINSQLLEYIQSGEYIGASTEYPIPEIKEATPGSGQEVSPQEVKDFVSSVFTDELLQQSYISEIVLDSGLVWVRFPEDIKLGNKPYDAYVPRNIFSEQYDKLDPEAKVRMSDNVRRAVSYVSYNSLHPALSSEDSIFPTPVYFFNQEFDSQSRGIRNGEIDAVGLQYLKEIPKEQQLEKYALGSIAHEIGHHIFEHVVLKSEQVEEIIELLSLATITEYADSFDTRDNPYLAYHEKFSEMVRLYTTAPGYLRNNSPELFDLASKLLER